MTIAEISIVEADTPERIRAVAGLVACLLTEIVPQSSPSRTVDMLENTASTLLTEQNGFWAFLAETASGEPVGVLTLNQCAAIYAGGQFGEIAELYVKPEHRSSHVGERLLETARTFARSRRWTSLEVGAPDVPKWSRSVAFYKANGFKEIGPRLGYDL